MSSCFQSHAVVISTLPPTEDSKSFSISVSEKTHRRWLLAAVCCSQSIKLLKYYEIAVISCVPRPGHEVVMLEHRRHNVRVDEGPHDPLTFLHFIIGIRRMRAINCQRRRYAEGSVINMGIESDWLKKKVNDMSVEPDWLTCWWVEMKTKVTSFS